MVKEELLQSEGAREDLKIKAQQQETDMLHMQQRIDELMVSGSLQTLTQKVILILLIIEKHRSAHNTERRG